MVAPVSSSYAVECYRTSRARSHSALHVRHNSARKLRKIPFQATNTANSNWQRNLVNQDQRRIKTEDTADARVQAIETAAIRISGIELAEKIRKLSSRRESCRPDPELLQTFGRLCWPA